MAFFRKRVKETVSPDFCKNDRLFYETANLQGVGARHRQEDAFTTVNALDPDMYNYFGLMFAVCDGMGGMKDGALASGTAVKIMRDSFSHMNINADIPSQLKNIIFRASEEVERVLEGEGGSTAVMGVIVHEQLYFISVGDSFLFLLRDGVLVRLNHLQTVCTSMYLENIYDGITETENCRNAADSAALSQFLGMTGMSEADCLMRPLKLRKGDVLLACSDGAGGVLSEAEIKEVLQCPSVHVQTEKLEEKIKMHALSNQDNYTALIIKCC